MLENNKNRGSRIKLIIIIALLKFHFFLTSFKDFTFPWLKEEFPDFPPTLKRIFPLNISWPVATMSPEVILYEMLIWLYIFDWCFG